MTRGRPCTAVGVALLLLAQVGTAQAATHQVTPSSDWQAIVNGSVAGDVIEFADGIYTAACPNPGASQQNHEDSSMLSITAGITLRAQNPGKAVLDADSVTSQTQCRVMWIHAPSGSTVEIHGFNITGGYAYVSCAPARNVPSPAGVLTFPLCALLHVPAG